MERTTAGTRLPRSSRATRFLGERLGGSAPRQESLAPFLLTWHCKPVFNFLKRHFRAFAQKILAISGGPSGPWATQRWIWEWTPELAHHERPGCGAVAPPPPGCGAPKSVP